MTIPADPEKQPKPHGVNPYDDPVPYIPTVPTPVDEATGLPDLTATIDQSGLYGDAQQQQAQADAEARNAERSQEGETGGTVTPGDLEAAPEATETPPEAPESAPEG